MSLAFVGAQIFDGQARHEGAALVIDAGRVQAICDPAQVPKGAEICEVSGLLAPGCVDLQVNGGGGLMLNNAPVPETVATMAAAHAQLGTTSILPTLITDTQEVTAQAIRAVHAAVKAQTPGVAGMHLEGPHLSVPRKGAHDAALIRPMTAQDCADLERAAQMMPSLMVTVAPENASSDQIARLAKAGAVVSLGHSDTDFDCAVAAAEAGARCVTHLFNAMSPMTSRLPGVVGAALDCGGLSAGVIADGIHVHRATLGAALRAKRGPGRIFLVSDAMALAGSPAQSFTLGGREIRRGDGALRLADGTLAGADLDMLAAVRFLVREVGVQVDEALRMATLYPADLLGRADDIGTLRPGAQADMVLLDEDLALTGVWQGGQRL